MKKALLVSMTIFTFINGFSQTEKGRKFINGQISLSGNNNYSGGAVGSNKYNSSSLAFQFVPNVGYFIKDNFAVGANLSFGVSNSTQEVEYPNQTPVETFYKSNSISYGIGGFARYYKKITDKFLFLTNGGVSYIYQTQKVDNSNNYFHPTGSPSVQTVQTNSFSVVITPGIVYFVSPKFGIETNFGNINYQNSSSKNLTLPSDAPSKSNKYGINLSVSTFFLGLNYYF